MHEQVTNVLKQCTVSGKIVKLPDETLSRPLYEQVAKALKLIGGRWKGGKVMGFVFQEDPTELLKKVSEGEKINLKKEYQFFATPAETAREMVIDADILRCNSICEPQAGQGSIVDEILRAIRITGSNYPKIYISELMEINRMVLRKKYAGLENVFFLEDINPEYKDFLNVKEMFFDRIIANPPFNKNQDIDHIRKMYELLTPGGRLVTLSSKHWMICENNKEKSFKDWLYNELEADINSIGAGTFAESGTQIETLKIIINKQKNF